MGRGLFTLKYVPCAVWASSGWKGKEPTLSKLVCQKYPGVGSGAVAHRETTKSRAGKRGNPPKSVYLTVGIWHDDKTGHIHMASTDKRFRHTTVSNKSSSKRFHANLYGKLKAVLISEGYW